MMEEKQNDGGGVSMNQEIFARETAMCKKLHAEKSGCNWGRCENCGVIPLLYKLCKGEFLENPEQIESVKGEIFGSEA